MPLYNSCSLLILVMKTGPLPAPSKCQSGRFNVPRVMKTKFPAMVMVFGVVSSEGHIMPPHIFEVGLKVNTKVYLDVLLSVVIPWCNQVAGGRPWVWQQNSRQPTSPKKPRLGFRRSATTLYPSLTGPPPPSTWTRWTTLFGHTSKTWPTWPPTTSKPAWLPSIRQASTGTCEKGMLPVLDPYRGGDWGWRRLHWIDVSSTTWPSYLNRFFSKKF